jgi:hypothetical protein
MVVDESLGRAIMNIQSDHEVAVLVEFMTEVAGKEKEIADQKLSKKSAPGA